MSGNLTEMAAEGQINAIVKEYLEFKKFKNTVKSFIGDCSTSKCPIGVLPTSQSQVVSANIQNTMVKAFCTGMAEAFYESWDTHVPVSKRLDDIRGRKLEFYTNIYFAVFPLLVRTDHMPIPARPLAVTMERLKDYLETKGRDLSQTTEFLPYYALPFVSHPQNHPSYKDIFEKDWPVNLQSSLEAFLSSAFSSDPEPRLNEAYMAYANIDAVKEQAKRKVTEAEKRTTFLTRRNDKLQNDYCTLIRISADLIDALEATIQGEQITPEYLHSVCQQLFANQVRQSTALDLRRPGTASQALRASIAAQPPIAHRSSTSGSIGEHSIPVQQLHFDKIKYVMHEGAGPAQALLLQALRWKLTRSPPSERDHMMTAFITHDVLGCLDSDGHKEAVLNLFCSDDQVVRQYTARLFNAVASLKEGRSYLAQNPDLLRALIDNLRSEAKDSITRENVLGALQKLSLRRSLQSDMINEGMIQWLVSVLDDYDALSDYTLEYSVALMMNLCLRTAGKLKCAEASEKVLQVLSDLLGHDNLEIRPYINGALYSILGHSGIKLQARKMSMEEVLRCFIKPNQPDMNRQLDFIIRQLNSEESSDDVFSDDEEEDDDDEDQDAMEADLDKAEVLHADPSDLSGEALLLTHYRLQPPSSAAQRTGGTVGGSRRKSGTDSTRGLGANGRGPLLRPATPNHIRMSTPSSHGFATMGSQSDTQHSLAQIDERGSLRTSSQGPAPSPSHAMGFTHSLQRPSSETIDRPYTRTKSRPNTGDMAPQRRLQDESLDVIGRAVSEERQRSTQSPPRSQLHEKVQGLSRKGTPDYQVAFAARPRIARTPEGPRSIGGSLPPAPTFSDNLPLASPRPTSGSKSIQKT